MQFLPPQVLKEPVFIRVPLLDESRTIMNKWGNELVDANTFIFPVLTDGLTLQGQFQLIQQFTTHLINDYIKVIDKAAGLESKATT